MTEKRYKRLVSSIDYYYCIDTTNDDKGLTEEDMLNRLNEQDKLIRKLRAEVEVHKHPLFSTRQAEEKIERYESDLKMCREKALYWRNKAEDIFGDMKTNVELKRENEKLKETIKELELENAKHIGDGEWDIRDITYGHGKFRLEEWGERYHQFYNGDKQLEDEEVVSLLFENEQLKKELFESEKDYIMETYSDNPIRRDEKIQGLKEEFKERFGDLTYITSDELLFDIINKAIEKR